MQKRWLWAEWQKMTHFLNFESAEGRVWEVVEQKLNIHITNETLLGKG